MAWKMSARFTGRKELMDRVPPTTRRKIELAIVKLLNTENLPVDVHVAIELKEVRKNVIVRTTNFKVKETIH